MYDFRHGDWRFSPINQLTIPIAIGTIAIGKPINMNYQPRTKISFVILIIIGLVIGIVIKKVKIGLIIGIVLGLMAGGLMSNREANKNK